MRRFFHFLLLAIFCPGVITENTKPNIIVILIDDAGWNDFGFLGSDQIKTPNIDALAYSGMILNRHYVLPSCTPSRTALLTGNYPIRTGMQGFPLKAGENRNVPLSFKLKPQRLKELGYKTHLVGKWHLGYETYNHVPNHRGFDTFFGYYNGYIDYYKYDYHQRLGPSITKGESFNGYDLHDNDDVHRVEKPKYATKLFTDRAQEIIRGHNISEPMYLYMSHLATHTGNDDIMGMQIPEDANVNKTYSYIKDYGRRVFAGCLEELDKSVGVVVEELEKKQMLDNSIILVMSDNGAHTVSVDMAPNWGSNWPLAGTKFTLYEGGVRGAALIWSPLLPKGLINYGFIHISDWLPTLYSAAGGDVDDLGEIDGIDQWESLKQVTTVKRENILLNVDDRTGAEGIIINDRWKVVKGGISNYAHYDLHWGKEANTASNPKYENGDILTSTTGRIIRSQQEYKNILSKDRISELRRKTSVKCNVPDSGVSHTNGYIQESSDFRCPEFCVFDIIKDPCELEKVKNEEVLNMGLRFLKGYKDHMMKQRDTYVDPGSDPEQFGGVWMPWNGKKCAKSFAKEFTSQYLSVAFFITLSWYSLRKLGR